MKLFQNLRGKDNGIAVESPVAGRLVSIKEVNDPTFSEEILGKGAAVIPSDNRICAPLDGTVTTMFPTGHAAAVTGDNGVSVLIHVGLDTVQLKGEYFTIHASDGQKVKKGDLLMEADIGKIKEAGYDVITPVIVCNPDDFSEICMEESGDVAQGDVILRLKK
ncbi:MAG: PTS glucose transporter subunit IIA [Blautia sp.]|nr:PTS glucose transporter subunit IIA [Blautia sp.]MCM1200586.1 PTS glucose transporter subunit IIA [Bacteroides fragilis]